MGLDLSTSLGNIKLKNPVLVSSGTFGYAQEYKDLVDLEELGAIVTKSITPKAKEGNSPPRIVETASGIINSIGLENVGLDRFIEEKLPFLKGLTVPIIVSIAGENIDDYLTMTERLNDEEISGIELNLSCPNVKSKNNLTFAQDKNEFSKIIKRVRGATSHTLIVKLSPNVTDIREIAQAAEAAGADAISLVNTFLATAIDIERQMPKLGNFTGGLSGPAIKPIALRMVYEVSEVVKISVIGQGGIMNAEDALEFLICGADAISVGTGNFIDPRTSLRIIDGIKDYMKNKRINKLSDLVGSLRV
ncbi:MAG TPA: dihydroorotate dehydrogenase [Candidatus Omnitrophica bacterium]|nr:dihydroorotate dehydrogenase [Candidatus Omnitrophota bacterium]